MDSPGPAVHIRLSQGPVACRELLFRRERSLRCRWPGLAWPGSGNPKAHAVILHCGWMAINSTQHFFLADLPPVPNMTGSTGSCGPSRGAAIPARPPLPAPALGGLHSPSALRAGVQAEGPLRHRCVYLQGWNVMLPEPEEAPGALGFLPSGRGTKRQQLPSALEGTPRPPRTTGAPKHSAALFHRRLHLPP